MKANFTIDPHLLKNSGEFNDSFFERFSLRHADNPLQLTDAISKNYLFPTFYSNVTCAIGIFLCDNFDYAKELMPHSLISPVRMPFNRTLVIISCYEYKSVLGIPPYNEIAMTIPVLANPKLNVPILPMIAPNLFNSFGYYVFSMPVTSEENRIRGEKIWGLPKVTEDIEITSNNDRITTTSFDENGISYLELNVLKSGKPTKFDVTSPLFTNNNGAIQKSYTSFKGTFSVKKNMPLMLRSQLPQESLSNDGKPWLKLYDSDRSSVLRKLNLCPEPFQFRYCHSMTSCFDLPRNLYS